MTFLDGADPPGVASTSPAVIPGRSVFGGGGIDESEEDAGANQSAAGFVSAVAASPVDSLVACGTPNIRPLAQGRAFGKIPMPIFLYAKIFTR